MPHLVRDGVRLYYEDQGAGDPPMLFVHGWCCDRTYHAPQAAHFSPKHRCVSIDLRGHGESDKPEQEYGIAGFADDVAWLCRELALKRPVIVGHSMGGAIALSLAARHPGVPAAIVMLDGAVLPPATLLALTDQFGAAFRSPAYVDAMAGLAGQMFLPSDDATRRARIIEQMTSTPRHVFASAWDAIWKNDSAADAALCRVPALYVGSHAPVADMARLREAMPAAVLAQTAGAGHFHQLEVPDQVNAMIERFLVINALA